MIDPEAALVDGVNEELDDLLARRTAALLELRITGEEIDRLLIARAADVGEEEA
jgi:hypothetical protein